MNKVIVLGSGHGEAGACNSEELLKIIQRLSPNIIFCEASPENFPAMVKATETFNTPEIKAIRAILEKQSIEIIPVDLHGDPFDRRLEAMFDLFRNNYKEYFYASEIQAGETHRLGFPFLNSEDSDQIHRDKNSMEKIFVARANHAELSKTHKDWLEWNDKRENHWIKVIRDYSEKNKMSMAVFLVGSAHRIRLMEKIKKFQIADKLIPEWDFNPFEQMKELEKLTDDQQAVIVHEAGHAAVAISYGLTPVEVKLGFDGKGLAKVTPEFKGYSPSDNKQRIAVLKAGFLAERKYTKQNAIDHGALDRNKINKILVEDCIAELEEKKIENGVIQFLNNNFDTKVLRLAELIANNYKKGQCDTLTAELENTYHNN